MGLRITPDPVPAHWWRRKVYRGWQFGYSGGTENDFMIDVEVAKWRFACYIGFKRSQNAGPGYERWLERRRKEEIAWKRTDAAESAGNARPMGRDDQAACHRMDKKQPVHHQALAFARILMARIDQLRFSIFTINRHDQKRIELAARPSLPAGVRRDAAAPIEGKLLHQEHQRPASDHTHHQDPEASGFSKGDQ